MQRLGEEAGVTARPRFCSYWRVVVSRWGLEGERLVRLQMYVAVLYVLASRPLCSIETESSCFEPQTNPVVTSSTPEVDLETSKASVGEEELSGAPPSR